MIGSLFGGFSRPGGALCLFAGYFILQWLLRSALGGGLELDEAEQIIFGQRLQIGYSPDPPLYTWLQIPLLSLLGDNAVALGLLKNLLLFASYASGYFIARQCGMSPERSGLAALSLILLPQIGWESQRDLTHSVLVTTLASVTLWALLALLNGRQTFAQYLLLGLLFGLGVLSKFNYVLFLLVALISLGSLRPRLLWRPAFLAALLVALALISPFLVWIMQNMTLATATSYKLETGGGDYWRGLAEGLLSLAIAYLSFGALFLVCFVAIFRPWRETAGRSVEGPPPLALRFLRRFFWITPVVMVAYLLISGGAVYRDRWLLPLLFFLPLLAFSLLPERLTDAVAMRRYKGLLLAVMIAIPLGLVARVYLYPLTGNFSKPHFPGRQLAKALLQEAGPFAVVAAGSSYIGGNLKPYLGAALVTTPTVDFPLQAELLSADGRLLLVWDGAAYPQARGELVAYLRQDQGLDLKPVGAPRFITRPYRFSRERGITLGWQYWE